MCHYSFFFLYPLNWIVLAYDLFIFLTFTFRLFTKNKIWFAYWVRSTCHYEWDYQNFDLYSGPRSVDSFATELTTPSLLNSCIVITHGHNLRIACSNINNNKKSLPGIALEIWEQLALKSNGINSVYRKKRELIDYS